MLRTLIVQASENDHFALQRKSRIVAPYSLQIMLPAFQPITCSHLQYKQIPASGSPSDFKTDLEKLL